MRKKTYLAALLFTLLAPLAGCGGGSDSSAGPGEAPHALRCGNGVCEFGEFCAVCPQDCDCTTPAATPPMGWNSWNRFGCEIDERLARETADAMEASGMRDAGYVYLNLDDCWQVSRAEDGTIVADPERFAGGMKALADYVHAKGLKFGLYTCAGTETCQGRPGSAGYEYIDARTYASWGVDYIKVDWCNTEGMSPRRQYRIMQEAIERSGRPMVYSICNWGRDYPHIWGPYTGNLWRTSGDIADEFLRMLYNFYFAEQLSAFAGPGHWNDPDMLEVGNGGMTNEEYRAHFSLWAILAAPLIAGNDLRSMTEETRQILMNTEVIAVDQDPWGLPGVRISRGLAAVWARPVAKEGARAVVLFNPFWFPKEMSVEWSSLGLASDRAAVRDLWLHGDLGVFTDRFTATLAPHEARMLLVQGSEHIPARGTTYLSDYPWMYASNAKGEVLRDLAATGTPLTLKGRTYTKGLGAFGSSRILYHLAGSCTRFSADVGVDDSASGTDGTVAFKVFADRVEVFDSGTVRTGMDPLRVDIPVDGADVLELVVETTGDSTYGDHADWADARIVCP